MLDIIFWIIVSVIAVGLPTVGLAMLVFDDTAFPDSFNREVRYDTEYTNQLNDSHQYTDEERQTELEHAA